MRDSSSTLIAVGSFLLLTAACLVPLPSAGEEAMSADQRARIIAAYGNALNARSSTVGRESALPFPKQVIRQAILEELNQPLPRNVNALEVGYVELESFVSDEEFKAVLAAERAVVEARALMASGNPEDTKRAAQLITETHPRARQVQQDIIARQEQRLRELRVRKRK